MFCVSSCNCAVQYNLLPLKNCRLVTDHAHHLRRECQPWHKAICTQLHTRQAGTQSEAHLLNLTTSVDQQVPSLMQLIRIWVHQVMPDHLAAAGHHLAAAGHHLAGHHLAGYHVAEHPSVGHHLWTPAGCPGMLGKCSRTMIELPQSLTATVCYDFNLGGMLHREGNTADLRLFTSQHYSSSNIATGFICLLFLADLWLCET